MSAQAIRAILLAKATAATSRGRLASKVWTQPGQLPALARLAGPGGAVVAHHLAREAREDRRPDRAPRPLRRVPARRGGGAEGTVRRDPAPDRPLARAARCDRLTEAGDGADGAEGEPCAEIDHRHQSSP